MPHTTHAQRAAILDRAFARLDAERPAFTVGSWRDDAEYDDGVAPPAPVMVEIAPGLRINRNFDWYKNAWLMPDDWA